MKDVISISSEVVSKVLSLIDNGNLEEAKNILNDYKSFLQIIELSNKS